MDEQLWNAAFAEGREDGAARADKEIADLKRQLADAERKVEREKRWPR